MTENNGEKRLSKEFLKKLLKSDFRFYYSTPYLNDQLYLHYKGFPKIENLEEFTGLKVIYLEGNGFSKIEGLDSLVNLRSLYLQENLIKKIENLDHCTQIANLNLSDNCIKKIENLGNLKNLGTLQIKRNSLGQDGDSVDALKGLLEVPTVSVLDISDNRLTDEAIVDEILVKMPNLSVLYLQNNEVCKKISNYRKTLIVKLPNLKYLDDRPVFPEERRFAEAFAKGGLELEREERKKYKQEQEEEHLRNHRAFGEMIERYRQEAREERERNAQAQQEDNSNSQEERNIDNPPDLEDVSEEERKSLNTSTTQQNSESLPTYNTATDQSSIASKRRDSQSSNASVQHDIRDKILPSESEEQMNDSRSESNYQPSSNQSLEIPLQKMQISEQRTQEQQKQNAEPETNYLDELE
ncbi:hypothetical protein ABPG74_007231 [Tetrahymena malaccensis]